MSKKASAILTADIHLREDQPVCWATSYWEAQKTAIELLCDLQKKHDCPVLVAGDLFHHWKPSPFLLQWALINLPWQMTCIPGQHDLPQHNLDLILKSGMGVLRAANKIGVISQHKAMPLGDVYVEGFPFGSVLSASELPMPPNMDRRVALAHVMTYRRRKPYPGCQADNATSILNKMTGFDLIVTGDNHETFVVENGEGILVNPGSLMRMTAAQVDHEPCVFLYYADDNSIQQVFIPQQADSISREHLEKQAERDQRIEAFVEALQGQEADIGLSFEQNLKAYLDEHKVSEDVKKLIWEVVE